MSGLRKRRSTRPVSSRDHLQGIGFLRDRQSLVENSERKLEFEFEQRFRIVERLEHFGKQQFVEDRVGRR
jgi:hypothetical protein